MSAKNDHSHSHAVRPDADRRLLVGALSLIGCFMIGEVIVGIIASSLALISDAGHMLTDAAAIALALVTTRLAAHPPRGGFTYGLKRAEILSAQINGLTFVALVVYFGYEGVHRLIEPPEVNGLFVLVTALAGVAVNLAATWLMSRANRTSLNVEGAFQHVLQDLYAFIATAAAGLVIVLTGFARADAIAALVIAALMAKSAYTLLRDSGRVFLEAAPKDINPARIDADLHAMPGVVDVHDLHVWEVTSGFPALSAHVLFAPGEDCHRGREVIEELLEQRYGIDHTTLQVDHRHDVVPPEQLRAGGSSPHADH